MRAKTDLGLCPFQRPTSPLCLCPYACRITALTSSTKCSHTTVQDSVGPASVHWPLALTLRAARAQWQTGIPGGMARRNLCNVQQAADVNPS